jgi:hypothetical protein
MKRRLAVAAVVSIVAVLAVGAATAAAPPPPRNAYATMTAFWPNLASLIGNKREYGSFDVSYQVQQQRLNWEIDYKGTTGPATDLRLRMRVAHGILSLSLCRPGCHSVQHTNARGPYYVMTGTIVRPPRDLVLMATGNASTDLILATAQYPRGELRAALQASPPPAASSGGHCC